MANKIYDEEAYLEKLRQLSLELKELAVCRVKQEYLDARGVPDGSVIFNRPKRNYRKKSGEEKTYQYTCTFLYINQKPYYLSKKYPYPKKPAYGVDVNNPDNPDNRLILQSRLEIRMEIRSSIKYHKKLAQLYCNSLNGMKSKKMARIEYEAALEEAYEELRGSDEYREICALLDKQPGMEWEAILETTQDEQRNPFRNEIYNDRGERLRSKNEMIAAWCAHDCGLSYTLEPFYPESNLRADFGLVVGGREVFVEISGLRTRANYEARLQEKQALAKKHGKALVIIDMTDYPGQNGEPYTRIYFAKLRHILQKIRLGLLENTIVTPY